MKILIAPNSFKECADSASIADLFYYYLGHQKNVILISKPISDGGDGFLNVCMENFGLDIISYKIPLPFGRRLIDCEVGYSKNDRKIYIESANCVGLKLIPSDKRHPLLINSRAMGVLLQRIIADIKAEKIFVDKVIIGIGGTGTNDMGIGMLSEFGLKLIDAKGLRIRPIPGNFGLVKKMVWEKINLPFQIDLISDVNNHLLGAFGASKTFGRQKGLTGNEIKIAEKGFSNIIKIIEEQRISTSPKLISGAGGGLAAGFQIFLDSNIIFSDKFISRNLGIKKTTRYSAVITAEGSFDNQSFMNKATGTIIKKFAETGTKIFLVCGILDKKMRNKLPENVHPVELKKYFKSKSDSIKYYKEGIRLASEEIKSALNY